MKTMPGAAMATLASLATPQGAMTDAATAQTMAAERASPPARYANFRAAIYIGVNDAKGSVKPNALAGKRDRVGREHAPPTRA